MNLNNLEGALFYDKISVKGLARISLSGKSCEFLSDFVPILPIDSQVTVITKVQNAPFLKIKGPVFLSSKKFMRIHPVSLALYENAEKHYDIPVRIPAKKIKKHFLSSDTYEKCEILNCSAEYLTLTGNLSPEHGDSKIELLVGSPIFSESVSVNLQYSNNGILFGKKNTGEKRAKYIYRIVSIEEGFEDELLYFIRRQGIETLAKAMKG